MERGTPVGRIVPLSPSVETRARKLVEAGLVAWSGQRLAPMAPVARTRGQRTVADLVLEDREWSSAQGWHQEDSVGPGCRLLIL